MTHSLLVFSWGILAFLLGFIMGRTYEFAIWTTKLMEASQ